jgi:bifunctional N-acetylglucosamine-1-phosphate-uridyltransferase/glucosamine-1-phosphate-acetyltransferase GlmU-like protein
MAAKDTVALILAAGKGTRLRSHTAKVLHRAGGRALVAHVIRAAAAIKPAEIIAVVGHQAEDVAAVVEPLGAKTVLQNPQRGTGHSVQVARRAIRRSAKFLLVVPGDAPLLRTEILASIVRAHVGGNPRSPGTHVIGDASLEEALAGPQPPLGRARLQEAPLRAQRPDRPVLGARWPRHAFLRKR